jgi:hypothetical protein
MIRVAHNRENPSAFHWVQSAYVLDPARPTYQIVVPYDYRDHAQDADYVSEGAYSLLVQSLDIPTKHKDRLHTALLNWILSADPTGAVLELLGKKILLVLADARTALPTAVPRAELLLAVFQGWLSVSPDPTLPFLL